MRNLSLIALLSVLIGLTAPQVGAFSLLGPYSAWQTSDIGYDLPAITGQENGGPRLRGDEYRLSTPVVTFGFDGSFVEYFGAPGMQAVQDAFATFSGLTNFSSMSANLGEYPLKADGVNPLAQTLGLIDLKTTVMASTLEALGLTAPDRWIWSIRARFVPPSGIPQYSVANLNFDPATGLPSRYVNGTLYSYVIREIFDNAGAVVGYDAREIPVDAAAPTIALASLIRNDSEEVRDGRLLRATGVLGRYFTGLTRDDIGGLRYIYRSENLNYEAAPAGSVRGSGTVSTIGSSASLDSPWSIVGGTSTIGTNAVGTGGIGNVRQLVNLGVRAGVDHIRFIRVDLDPILRVSPAPVVVSYPELVISNGLVISQIVVRTNARPDYLISAADVGVVEEQPVEALVENMTFLNNGSTLTGNAEGPGNIEPVFGIQFSKLGLYNLNSGNSDEQDGFRGFLWSSFDGSTNAPTVYPVGTRLEDLQAVIDYLTRN
jgi:hypothetical protein